MKYYILISFLFLIVVGRKFDDCICDDTFFPMNSHMFINYIYFDGTRCIKSNCYQYDHGYSFHIPMLSLEEIKDSCIISIGGIIVGYTLYFMVYRCILPFLKKLKNAIY